MTVEFHDFHVQVITNLKQKAIIGLTEACNEMASGAKQISRYKTRHLAGSYDYHVDSGRLEGTVGSPLENAIWEEYGTGRYAEKGDGRQGYWVYVKGNDSSGSEDKNKKTYTLEQAKKIMAMMRSDGLEAYYTNGKKPHRTLRKAFETKKATCLRIIQNRLREV